MRREAHVRFLGGSSPRGEPLPAQPPISSAKRTNDTTRDVLNLLKKAKVLRNYSVRDRKEVMASSNTEQNGPDHDDKSWFVMRPSASFLQLPLEFRWEATRRHPYYLRFWRTAAEEPDEGDTVARLRRDAAKIILKAVNVVGVPVDPATSFDDLNGHHVSPAFLGGALAPFTLRGALVVLATSLDPDALGQVAMELAQLADSGIDRSDSRILLPLLQRLNSLPISGLDSIPNEGIVSFNPRSPSRAIIEDLSYHVKAIKRQLGVRETRRRPKHLKDFFQVWDDREGWTGSGYERAREKRLTKISKARRRPLKTVSDQYHRAFEVIFGTPYRAELWLRTILPLKVPQLGGDGRLGRPLHRRQPRPVHVSSVTGENDPTRLLDAAGFTDHDFDFVDLMSDLKDLIRRGWSGDEIVAELELRPEHREVINVVRERLADDC